MIQLEKGYTIKYMAEYKAWQAMRARCYKKNHPKYKHYGARGITVCAEWLGSFQNFLNIVGPKPGKEFSLERKDNNGGYEPNNVKWATYQEQARNRRGVKKYFLNGKYMLLKEIALEYKIPESILRERVHRLGWTIERALTQPLRSAQWRERISASILENDLA